MIEEWPMPLLCSSLCVLLLLPLMTLSCSSTKSPKEIEGDYKATIQTELVSTTQRVGNLLQNTSCLDQRDHQKCTSNYRCVVTDLFNAACKMKNLSLLQTTQLVDSVQLSLHCPCPDKPSRKPKDRSRAFRKTRQEQKKRKLCQAKAFLTTIAECYELLNTGFSETWNSWFCGALNLHILLSEASFIGLPKRMVSHLSYTLSRTSISLAAALQPNKPSWKIAWMSYKTFQVTHLLWIRASNSYCLAQSIIKMSWSSRTLLCERQLFFVSISC